MLIPLIFTCSSESADEQSNDSTDSTVDEENQVIIETIESPANTITFDTAYSGGIIAADGGSSITEKGVVWSELPNPTISLETKTNDGAGASDFESIMSGLNETTEYFYRAYATNSSGTFYGDSYVLETDNSIYYDQDNDGYTPDEGDCDDQNENVNPTPYMLEIIDGIDNNCDGNIDFLSNCSGTYTLEMYDGYGDGWTECGISVCIDSQCNDYSLPYSFGNGGSGEYTNYAMYEIDVPDGTNEVNWYFKIGPEINSNDQQTYYGNEIYFIITTPEQQQFVFAGDLPTNMALYSNGNYPLDENGFNPPIQFVIPYPEDLTVTTTTHLEVNCVGN